MILPEIGASMNVKELIDTLKTLDPEMTVFTLSNVDHEWDGWSLTRKYTSSGVEIDPVSHIYVGTNTYKPHLDEFGPKSVVIAANNKVRYEFGYPTIRLMPSTPEDDDEDDDK